MADLLTGAEPPISTADLLRCAERELRMRERVYPRWVAAGKMKEATSDYEIRAMTAIVATLRRLTQ